MTSKYAFALVLALFAASSLAGADEADAFFDDSEVRSVFITFDDQNWYDTLYVSHKYDPEDPYFPAHFEFEGIVLDPVGVRFKGNSSFGIQGEKKSFKIDFNEYDEGGDGAGTSFLGLTKLNLNNGFKDPTMMRAKLFLDFTAQFGPALRATHVRVHVNGEYWGLYTAVEQLDKNFVQRCFGSDEDGNLFEGESSGDDPQSVFGSDLSYLGPNASDYYDHYELKTNEAANDWSGLVEFIDVLNNTRTEDLPSALEQIFDIDSWLMALAQDVLFLNLDSYIGSAHNYYLYDRDDTGLMTYLHWDTNETFGTFLFGMPPNQDLLTLDPFWVPEGPPGSEEYERPLMQNIWAVPEYRTKYLRSLALMMRQGFDAESFDAVIQTRADLIRPHVYEDPHKPYSNTDFETALTSDDDNGRIYGLRHFVEARSAYLDPALDNEAQVSDLQLNELMTLNLGTAQDDHGDYDPWIEIYNLGPGRIALDRLSLSDDPVEPSKWQLPAQELDDGRFIVLWIDGEPSEGNVHSTFSLDPSGGELHLYSGNQLIDSFVYEGLDADISWIRLPDGEGVWTASDQPTPGSSNLGSSIPPGLFINEIMAENDSTITDPASEGAFPDWFELYNSEATAINLGGMYLSDDLNDPQKWQIPEGVTIETCGFLLIWADNDEEQGPNHASFKLDAAGETLTLYDRDENGNAVIDEVNFPEQTSDISWGRETDGGDIFGYFNNPTPGTSNVSTSDSRTRNGGRRFRP